MIQYQYQYSSGGERMVCTLDVKTFYPEYIDIEAIEQTEDGDLHIQIKTVSQVARCPECGKESARVHSRCEREKIRDLPILGKGVQLTINARRFFCENEECRMHVFTESMPCFIGSRWKWTRRCEELIVAVAMNTRGTDSGSCHEHQL